MKIVYTIIFLLILSPSNGQTMVTGKVVDEKGEPIPGANILIRDTYDGASSGADGAFSFSTAEKGTRTLVTTFVGFKSVQQSVVLEGNPVSVAIKLKEEINQLEGVVISAGAFTAGEEKRRTILKAVDIATTAGATADIAGALNTLPGTQKVGETGRLFVRGGDGSEARTFIDGMLVLDAYSPSAPNTPSRGRFLPFMFKGTSFSTGGYSAEYGQALSSALVLTSKDKAELNQTDIGLLSVGGDIAHTQIWNRSSLSGKIQYTNIQPYFSFINQRVDWNKAPVSVDGSSAYRMQVGKDGVIKFFGNYSHAHFSMYNHDILYPDRKHLFDLTNNYGYGNTVYQQSLNDKWSVRGGLSYNYNRNAVKLDGGPMDEQEQGIHSKLVFENSLSDKVEWRFGGEWITRNYVASRQDEGSAEILSTSFRETISSSFVEAEAYANNHFVAKAGGRFEYNDLNAQASVDPRLSLAWKPGRQGQFSFAYGRFRQSAQNQHLRANTSLNPEKAEHFILNYQVITSERIFRVETYYKKYNDLIKYISGTPDQPGNEGDGYAKGAELFWRDSKTLRNVDYWVSYSFLDTERNYLDFPHAAAPAFASKHNFSLVYKHFITEIKSQLGFTYSYSSGRPYYNPNNESFHSDRTPSYQDLSANVAYLPRNWLIIYASCTNLLGRNNLFGYEYSSSPNTDGVYVSRALRQPASRFLFLGVFITISKNKSVNQLPNL